MTWTIAAAGIIAPAIFWVGYFYYKDRFFPEPLDKTGLAYILGILSALGCTRFYELLSLVGVPLDPSILQETNKLLFLFYCIGIVGVFEEIFKFLPFLIAAKFLKEFDEKIDGIFYASIVALGFATYENLHYLVYMSGWQLLGRAFASPLTHTIFASIWGYAYARARFSNRSLFKASIIGLLIAAVLHGLFDFLTLTPALRVLSALAILVIWVWRIVKIEELHRQTQPR